VSNPSDRWYSLRIQAQPWTTGRISIGRKAGGVHGYLSPDAQLQQFQEAVREELLDADPLPPEQRYKLTFYVWRAIETYTTPSGRHVTKKAVDATDIQKGLEDALQGSLIGNDRDVAEIRTVLVEQSAETEPFIVIHAEVWEGLEQLEIPEWVWIEKDKTTEPLDFDEIVEQSHDYAKGEDLF